MGAIVLLLAIMAFAVILWVTETVPFAVTSLFVVLLIPILRLADFRTVVRAAFTSSLAFILVSEGPTTIIRYSSGYFSIKDMAKAGIVMTVAAAACVALSVWFNQLLGV